MKITFPNKTAKQIVKECKNDTGIGKLLWNIEWYEQEAFYSIEKCRPRTMEVSDEIEHIGKSWNECAKLAKDGSEMMNVHYGECTWCPFNANVDTSTS